MVIPPDSLTSLCSANSAPACQPPLAHFQRGGRLRRQSLAEAASAGDDEEQLVASGVPGDGPHVTQALDIDQPLDSVGLLRVHQYEAPAHSAEAHHACRDRLAIRVPVDFNHALAETLGQVAELSRDGVQHKEVVGTRRTVAAEVADDRQAVSTGLHCQDFTLFSANP